MKSARYAALTFCIAVCLYGQGAVDHGTVEHIKVHGKSLEGNLEGDSPDRDVIVYLPPSYAKQTNRRYPVVYFGNNIAAESTRANMGGMLQKAVKWLWEKIGGNFLTWLLAPLGAAVLGSLVWFGQRFPPNAYLPATVCIVSGFLFFLVLQKIKPSSTNVAAVPDNRSDSVRELVQIPIQKLRIEVLNGFAGRWTEDGGLFGFSELRILFILRVAPTSDPGVGVKSWSVEYLDSSERWIAERWRVATIESIPDYLEYTAKLSGDIDDKPKRVDRAIAPLTYSHKILYGTHAEGALWVTVYGDNVHDFFRHSFQVKAIDSLDRESECIMEPGEWLRPATFKIGEPPTSLFPRYLAPPPTFQ